MGNTKNNNKAKARHKPDNKLMYLYEPDYLRREQTTMLTDEQRHRNMAANKSKGTAPEILLGKLLRSSGVRCRRNVNNLPGKPDFVVMGHKIAVFCDGEFWHGRNWEVRRNDHKTNREFWHNKIERNIERDTEVNRQLEASGWKIFRFWDTDIKKSPDICINKILNYIN